MIFFKARPAEPQAHPDDQRANSEAFAKVTGFFTVILAIVGSALVYFGVDHGDDPAGKMVVGLVASGICLLCLVPVFAALCFWFVFRALRARHISDYHADTRRQQQQQQRRPKSAMPIRATFQPEEGEPEMVHFSKF